MMNYYRELAFELRVRGMSEEQIRSTLTDVRSLASESGVDPREQFGAPEAYAGQFDKRTSTTAGKRFLMIMVIVAVACTVGLFVVSRVIDVQMRVVHLSVPLVAGVVVVVIGLVGGFLLDRRLPRGFTAPTSAR